ncbi:uncharacterized protein LOC134260249 [Saccostrea cucullata]|uniref:uncharacterized protein LOC134260249 n=1 Tax=Saccostrea cuccullata TaxID=36930 RepID=UPI002ED03534
MATGKEKGILTDAITEDEQNLLVELGKRLTNGHPLCMKIKNLSDTAMVNGCVAPNRGIIHSVLPASIAPNSFHCLGFHKTRYSLYGTVGVVAYDVDNFKLCIMYGNPYRGMNKAGFLWCERKKEIVRKFDDKMLEIGTTFYSGGTMKWTSSYSPDEKYIAEGFVSQGDPAYLHIHVRNNNA